MRKIVVLNPKGGSGKTTIATNLAAYYAAQGLGTVLMDFDPQGSTRRWLRNRPPEQPQIQGIAAFEKNPRVTRSFLLRLPAGTQRVVVDTPAAVASQDMGELVRDATAIIVPVLPSDIDIHACSRCIADLLLVAKVSRSEDRIGVVANRVRRNTLAFDVLTRFLQTLEIPVITTLRDSQHYVRAAELGTGIHEMKPYLVREDTDTWEPLLAWIDARSPQSVAPSPSPLPSPSPSPSALVKKPLNKVQILSPRTGESFALERRPDDLEKKIEIRWQTLDPESRTRAILTRRGDPSPIFDEEVESKKRQAVAQVTLEAPGTYLLEIRGTEGDDRSLAKSEFQLLPDFEAIELQDPLIGGRKLLTNKLDGARMKDFEVTLRWNAYRRAKKYRLTFGSDPEIKNVLFEMDVSGDEYILKTGKILVGNFYYRVSAVLPSGFRPRSKIEVFNFNFLPPTPVMPRHEAVLNLASLSGPEGPTILLTWEKTHFTDSYELEISADERFERMLTRQRLSQNFYVFQVNARGKFWWRVRGFAKELASGPSNRRAFTVK